MTLKELKTSLRKLPPDMDDMSVILLTLDDKNKEQYSLLSGTGVTDSKNVHCIVLLSDETCCKMIRNKTLRMKKDIEINEN